MKSINDYLKSWVKKVSVSSVDVIAKDIMKCVESYNYNLTWDQISILEPALGDFATNKYHNRDTNTELLSIVGFIIACGMANNKN